MEKQTLIINAGSSSVKFRLYKGDESVLDGVVDKIGDGATLEVDGEERDMPAPTHKEAGLIILSLIEGKIDRVVHRLVHGLQMSHPAVVTEEVVQNLKKCIPLAPLHIPPELDILELMRSRTEAEQIVFFDTMFHRTMPHVSTIYPIPQDLAHKYGIERYGFHGIAHSALLHAITQKVEGARKVITCQLGNGSSVCAILDGKSVDTSMGFTPLEGVMMGTRSGSIDPSLVQFLCNEEQLTVNEVTAMLDKQSGLFAIGGSNDVRALLEKESEGDKSAILALDMFAYHVKRYIGAYAAVLNGVDAIALGGGIARAPAMRRRLISGLDYLGVEINDAEIEKDTPVNISKKLPVWAFEVDEQKEMFEMTKEI